MHGCGITYYTTVQYSTSSAEENGGGGQGERCPFLRCQRNARNAWVKDEGGWMDILGVMGSFSGPLSVEGRTYVLVVIDR